MFRMNAETSTACHDDLAQHKLLNHYPAWQPKTEGCMDGLILFGKRKTGAEKKVFVKRYQSYQGMEFHELDDFLVFQIARACGVTVPTVKLKATTNHFYLFSTDITQKKISGEDHALEFLTLDQMIVRNSPYLRKPSSNLLLSTESTQKECIHVDETSVAKFILLCVMLKLLDLRPSNAGVLISHTHGNATAKLALIDFTIDYQHPAIANITSYKTLEECVMHQFAVKNFLRSASLVTLDNSDYLNAFHEIEQVFLSACDDANDKSEKYAFESMEKKSHAEKLIASWKSNFHQLQALAHRSEMDHSHTSKPCATMSP